MSEQVLDPCCGPKMFYFDKVDKRVLFGDIRKESHILCDGRALNISPDQLMDFRELPFGDGSFSIVVFDPPHLTGAGKTGWQGIKYGILSEDWQSDLRAGFSECFRVLKPGGVLVFKWNETRIPVSKILSLTDQKPLIGHKSGKQMLTHWILFMKEEQ